MTHGDGLDVAVRKFRLTTVEGPTHESSGTHASIGSHDGNDLKIADPTVSRYHCEIVLEDNRFAIVDLGSTNGTIVDGVHVKHAYLRDGSLLRLGKTTIRFDLAREVNRVLTSERRAFGGLVGVSPAMRHVFAVLERAAASDATVLLEGETGTGKGEAAEALHRASARRTGPFVTVDCGAIPANLLESELFGHERGAFTGATAQRIGAFEEANGGTVFLDEIGEMPRDLQPKLLRVLETRTLRRVGGTGTVQLDVRIIAATNRDLRTEVNATRFRADLYFRLAVVRCALPALRQRPEDLPLIADAILRRLGADEQQLAMLEQPGFRERIAGAAWPGNVRELRNYLERCLVFQDVLPLGDETESLPTRTIDPAEPLTAARDRAAMEFERKYLEALLAKHDRMIDAAAAAGIGRVYLYKLMVKHGLRRAT
jgi:two-component system, NtrC family, response regulator GlrR